MSRHPPKIGVVGMTKVFGALTALDDVSITFEPGCFHALLGENGAGKSTLVKCLMGTYQATKGSVMIDDTLQLIKNPRQARQLGMGMVFQHFTLVPSMSVAENLVVADETLPAVISWVEHRERLSRFMASMPFKLDLDRPVSSLAAGEKQKLEILKQLYMGRQFLILDEPTSVLTLDEADQILGHLRTLTDRKELSVVLITHKLREVEAFAREVSVLRAGKLVGAGEVGALSRDDMITMMIGRKMVSPATERSKPAKQGVGFSVEGLRVDDDNGLEAVGNIAFQVSHGEIVGIAGVSGNGQSELLETLAGQRTETSGTILIDGKPYRRTREEMRAFGVHILPEAPLSNACVRTLSVANNIAIRTFDQSPHVRFGMFVNRSSIILRARLLIDRFRIKTQGPNARVETLSGGNVQRTVLARELNDDVEVLIVQNPCFGLDVDAASETRSRIMKARNCGAAVLLISEDLDEILELSDRILVMFEGLITHETERADADIRALGYHMASHSGHATETGDADARK